MEERTNESEISEMIKEAGFENVSGGPLRPSKELYHPREFDLSMISAQLSPEDMRDSVIHIQYFPEQKRYGFAIYKKQE